MKVALITSWQERCGIAEYAANLTKHLSSRVEFAIFTRDEHPSNVINEARVRGCDLLHVNYEPGIMGHWTSTALSTWEKKSVLTLHTSHAGDNRTPYTDCYSKVVVHEECPNIGRDNFSLIPMGIPVWNGDIAELHGYDVGTVGFPFPWKGFTEVVLGCKELGLSCLIIIPESRHADAKIMRDHLMSLYDKVTVISHWLDQDQVIAALAACKMTAFVYHGANSGISAACRLGLATGKPTLLSRCRQFRDLFKYDEELIFIDQPPTAQGVAAGLKKLQYGVCKPDKLIKDMGWNIVAEQYLSLYEELV